jgi:hypothetical protein
MSDLLPRNTSPQDDLDLELALTFLDLYRSLEEALVRAGYTQAGHKPGNARPDWDRFARDIEGKFDADASPELAGAVGYLLADPEKHKRRRERLQASLPGERPSAESDIAWLAERVREIRDRLLYQINFPGVPGGDLTDVLAAWYVIQAWSSIEP